MVYWNPTLSKMNRFLKIIAIFGLFVGFITHENRALAGHVSGAYITWKFLDSNTLAYELHVFRDCRGIPFGPSQSAIVRFLSSGRDTAIERTATRLRINDVSPMCSKETTRCNGTGFGGSGLEVHVYTDTMLLSKFGIRTNDAIRIEFNNCCRNTAITTGVGGIMHTYALIHERKGESSAPRNLIFYPASTSTVYYNPEIYPLNSDSISYEWVEPMTAPGKSSFYTTPNGLPVEVYYANGRSYPYVDIRSFPPQGFYFSEFTGDMIFECPKTSLVTTIVYKIKQWTLQNGKYKLASEFLLEQPYVSGLNVNQAPQLIKKHIYRLTSGVKADMLLQTYDRPVQNTNDSVTVSWKEKLKGASYTLKDSANKKNPALLIEWTPPAVDRISNFYPIVNLSDDHCPFRSEQQHTIYIEVRNKPTAHRTFTSLSCGKLALHTAPDSTNMGRVFTSWRVLDQSGNLLNKEAYHFLGRSDTSSLLTEDTLQFYQSGTFIIEHQVWYPEFEFHQIYLDTIQITENFPDLISISDTFHCQGTALQLRANPIPLADSVHWYLNGKFEGKGTLSLEPDTGRYRIMAQLIDSMSCVRRDYFSLSVIDLPNADLGEDVFLCEPYEHHFRVGSAASYPWADHQVKWNGRMGADTNSTSSAGMFVVEVQNRCGISKDTLWVLDRNYNIPAFEDKPFCEGDTLVLGSPYNGIPWQWYNADSAKSIRVFRSGQFMLTLFSACGEEKRLIQKVFRHSKPRFLLPDETAICDGQARIISAGNFDAYTHLLWNDSQSQAVRTFSMPGQYVLSAQNACGLYRDTVFIVEQETPELKLPADTFFCSTESIWLNAGKQDGIYRWYDGPEEAERELKAAGIYLIEMYNYCGSDRDTVVVEEFRFFPPQLGKDTLLSQQASIRLSAGDMRYGHRCLWSTGDTIETIVVEAPGTFVVQKWNACGSASDTIHLKLLTGVNEVMGNPLYIYPNPTSDHLTLKGVKGELIQLGVSDLLGRDCNAVSYQMNGEMIELDISDLSTGRYQIEVLNAEGRVWRAWFIKQ